MSNHSTQTGTNLAVVRPVISNMGSIVSRADEFGFRLASSRNWRDAFKSIVSPARLEQTRCPTVFGSEDLQLRTGLPRPYLDSSIADVIDYVTAGRSLGDLAATGGGDGSTAITLNVPAAAPGSYRYSVVGVQVAAHPFQGAPVPYGKIALSWYDVLQNEDNVNDGFSNFAATATSTAVPNTDQSTRFTLKNDGEYRWAFFILSGFDNATGLFTVRDGMLRKATTTAVVTPADMDLDVEISQFPGTGTGGQAFSAAAYPITPMSPQWPLFLLALAAMLRSEN